MLEGIDKISPRFDGNQNSKFAGSENPAAMVVSRSKAIQKAYKFRTDDGHALSPFTEYLRQVKWDLKEFLVSSSEKIQIMFVYDSIEFKTEIDIPLFRSIPTITYLVTSVNRKMIPPRKITATISVRKDAIELGAQFEPKSLNGLVKFFQNIYSIDLASMIDKEDSYAIRHLTEGLKEKMTAEMKNITVGIFNLLEKIGRIKLAKFDFAQKANESVVVEKIVGE